MTRDERVKVVIYDCFRNKIDYDEALIQLNEIYTQRPLLVNGQYQCEHVGQNVLSSECIWCEMSVLEGIRQNYLKLLKKKELTEQDIASELLVLRDENGDDPFIRYQDYMASKGWLRHLIAKTIYQLSRRE